MSTTPVKKLPASPRVSNPGVPVTDRGCEKVNVGFSDFGASSGNQLRDPRLGRSTGDDCKFSHGNEFHMSPLLYVRRACELSFYAILNLPKGSRDLYGQALLPAKDAFTFHLVDP